MDYHDTLLGDEPSRSKAYKDAESLEEQLNVLIRICTSQFYVLVAGENATYMPTNEQLNPANLSCVCKGYRGFGICSHVIMCNTLHPDGYQIAYLKGLFERLCEKPKRAAHGPKRTRGGTSIQPQGDSASESDEDEEPKEFDDQFEDLDLDEEG